MLNAEFIANRIQTLTDVISKNQIDQNYFTEIFEIVNMKGNEGFKSIEIYWGGRWELKLSLEFLHNIECKDHCIVIFKSGRMVIIPYRNIDYVRLI